MVKENRFKRVSQALQNFKRIVSDFDKYGHVWASRQGLMRSGEQIAECNISQFQARARALPVWPSDVCGQTTILITFYEPDSRKGGSEKHEGGGKAGGHVTAIPFPWWWS